MFNFIIAFLAFFLASTIGTTNAASIFHPLASPLSLSIPEHTSVVPTFHATSVSVTGNICSNFHPGMEFRVTDDSARNADGMYALKSNLSQDVHSFNGVVYQTNWGRIETSPSVYDWSNLDAALAYVKSKGKYFRVKFEDRTFLSGCSSSFIPPYIARDANYKPSSNACYAKIWEQATMDSEIALLTTLAKRYSGDPYFSGIIVEETALDSISLRANPVLYLSLYAQLERLATAVHNAAPNIIFTQYVNWPYNGNNLAPVVANLAALGGGIGWPDSMIADEYTWSWYQFARDNYKTLMIAPSVESGDFDADTTVSALLADNEATYQMLVGDLHANIIVWDNWNALLSGNYFTQVVIPTVNNHNGAVQNTTCPFAAPIAR